MSSSYYDNRVFEQQWAIDKIRDEAQNFLTRVKLVITERIYMIMLNSPPALIMLNGIFTGNAQAVLTPSMAVNNTSETLVSKTQELTTLKTEVVTIIRRLFKVVEKSALRDLLSGEGKTFISREAVYYWTIYDEVTTEEDRVAELGPPDHSNWMENTDYNDDGDHEPICKGNW